MAVQFPSENNMHKHTHTHTVSHSREWNANFKLEKRVVYLITTEISFTLVGNFLRLRGLMRKRGSILPEPNRTDGSVTTFFPQQSVLG